MSEYYRENLDRSRWVFLHDPDAKELGGAQLVPNYLDDPLPGVINAIRRLLKKGGYKRINYHEMIFNARDRVKLNE